jgi:GNAT superfamily N-acetyltransferase
VSRFTLRAMKAGEEASCEGLLRSLPEWFGIEDAILQYRRDLDAMDTIVAEAGGSVIGFLTVHRHNPHAGEIHVMAVGREHHGQGIGRALVEHAEEILVGEGMEFLQVKTLGPSRPNRDYARTRAFYQRMGFRPLEENRLWGDVNPCLILVKHLDCRGAAPGKPS